jgi:hypothetical protein
LCHPLISPIREQDPLMSSRSCNENDSAHRGREEYSCRRAAERIDADLVHRISRVTRHEAAQLRASFDVSGPTNSRAIKQASSTVEPLTALCARTVGSPDAPVSVALLD